MSAFVQSQKSLTDLAKETNNAELWVVSRLKTNLLLTVREGSNGRGSPLLILAGLPTNILEQVSLEGALKCVDFTKQITGKVLLAVETDSINERHKEASRKKLRQILGSALSSESILVSESEALGAGNRSAEAVATERDPVDDALRLAVKGFNEAFEMDDTISPDEREVAQTQVIERLQEYEFSATPNQKKFIAENFRFTDVLKEHSPGILA